MKTKQKPKISQRIRTRGMKNAGTSEPQMLTHTDCDHKAEPAVQQAKSVLNDSKDATTIACLPEESFEQSLSPAVEITQAIIDAEALEIARRRMKRHAKTWTELAKY